MAKKRETGDAARVLPNNLEAERGVLGAILLDPQLCDDVSLVVRPDDFYLDKHRRIYRRLLAMNAESTGVDVTLLVEALRSSGELEEIGGEAYLAELMTSVQVTAHASHYAKIVAQNSMRRMVIGVCETALNDAYSPEIQPKELVARTEERIFEINDKHNTTRIERMSDLLPEVFHLIDARAAGEVDGVPTGFKDLDKMIGGLHGS